MGTDLSPNPSAPIRELIDALQRVKPLTVLIDALDEAADPEGLIRYVLRPLIEMGGDRLRLLLGTRGHLIPLLLPESSQRTDVIIDLDDSSYADPASVHAYTRRVLLESQANSPYRTAPEEVLDGVADAVSEAADTSFLVAGLSPKPSPQNPDPPIRESSLATQPAPQCRYRDSRGPPHPTWATRQPWPRSCCYPWLTHKASGCLGLASGHRWPTPYALGRTSTDHDLEWLRRFAGSYIKEGFDSIQSVYRLFHQSLAEHLREGRNLDADHAAITQALIECVRPAAAACVTGHQQTSTSYSLEHPCCSRQ